MPNVPARIRRWGLALAVTILALLFTLLPATSPFVKESSRFLGGTQVTDAIGHVILMAALTGVWYIALRERLSNVQALWAAALLSLALGTTTELAQSGMTNRGASLLDLAANVGGVSLAVYYMRGRFT